MAPTWTDDERDPQHAISTDAYERLARAQDSRGRALEIHKIHQPDPLYIAEHEARGVEVRPRYQAAAGGRLDAASYVNFYVGQGIVVLPSFGDRQDKPAREAIEHLFPDRRPVMIPSREILLGGGGIHCITLQEPLGRRA